MDQSSFASADPILDEIGDMLDELLDSDQLSAIRLALTRLSTAVGSSHSVNLNVCVEVFNEKRLHALPLLTTGLTTSGGKPPYKTSGDSSPHRYVVDGDIQVVPHDRCPRCYGLWDSKLTNPSCSECGANLGREVKMLLDSDVCPFCEEGRVSLTNPTCAKCGQQINPDLVVWG
jgi:hypothetical protein